MHLLPVPLHLHVLTMGKEEERRRCKRDKETTREEVAPWEAVEREMLETVVRAARA